MPSVVTFFIYFLFLFFFTSSAHLVDFPSVEATIGFASLRRSVRRSPALDLRWERKREENWRKRGTAASRDVSEKERSQIRPFCVTSFEIKMSEEQQMVADAAAAAAAA